MKKLFTLLTASCISASAFAQVLHTTDFATATDTDFAAWSVVDVNNDGKTWQFDSSGSPSHVFYSYHGSNNADDWMISPAITSTQSGTIAVSFGVKGSSYIEKIELFYGDQPTVEAMTNKVSETLSLKDNETSHIYLVNVEANKPIYLGFHACSDADKWRLYLCNVKAEFTANPVDLQVSEILSPVTDFGLAQETVKVKVKNSGTVDVDAFTVSYSVDGTTVATEEVNAPLAKGAEMEYTFAAKADLSAPRKNFAIKAWTTHADDINTSNDAATASVLHKAPATVPYTMGFEASEYTDGITFFNLNEDDGNWDLYTDPWWSLAHTGDYCLAYNYNKYNNGNDWAILEPIEIKEAGYYVLKFWYSGDDTHPEKLGVYYGSEATPEAMTNTIVEYAPFARSAYEESINIIQIDQPKTIYIGFHAFSDKDENWLCVDDVVLEKVDGDKIDLGVTAISNPAEYVHQGSKLDIGFTVRNFGIKDVASVIRVKIGDNVVSETSTTIKAQAIVDLSVKDALKSLEAGKHTITVEVVAEGDVVAENNTKEKEFRVMGTPAMRWDFEECILPKDFTFRSEDEGTVNPSAGSEFNEEGWGLFAIQKHEQLGEYVLAGTSWLDGTDQADRWCILPPFIASDDTHLVWDASSFNPSFLETYSVMVSSSGDDSWWYYTEKKYSSESAEFKTRGLDLSFYKGKEIYVAFRLQTANGEALILDNIDIHGDITTGVEEVSEAKAQVKVENGAIKVVGAEAQSLEVFDMNGRCVVNVAANEVFTEALSAGIYSVRVTTAGNTTTQKVIIK